MRAIAVGIAVAVALAGCGADAPRNETVVERRGDALEDVPLRANEAPDGLEEDARGTGPVAGLRDILPRRRDAPGLPPVPPELFESFVAGYERLFTGARRTAASSALRFADASSAAQFLSLLHDIHTDRLEEEGDLALELGDEGYAWTHDEPGAQSSGAVWRRGDLVLSVSLSGPLGEASPGGALGLARVIDTRLR